MKSECRSGTDIKSRCFHLKKDITKKKCYKKVCHTVLNHLEEYVLIIGRGKRNTMNLGKH